MEVVLVNRDLIEGDFGSDITTYLKVRGIKPEMNYDPSDRRWHLGHFKRSNPVLVAAVKQYQKRYPYLYIATLPEESEKPEDFVVIGSYLAGECIAKKGCVYIPPGSLLRIEEGIV